MLLCKTFTMLIFLPCFDNCWELKMVQTSFELHSHDSVLASLCCWACGRASFRVGRNGRRWKRNWCWLLSIFRTVPPDLYLGLSRAFLLDCRCLCSDFFCGLSAWFWLTSIIKWLENPLLAGIGRSCLRVFVTHPCPLLLNSGSLCYASMSLLLIKIQVVFVTHQCPSDKDDASETVNWRTVSRNWEKQRPCCRFSKNSR